MHNAIDAASICLHFVRCKYEIHAPQMYCSCQAKDKHAFSCNHSSANVPKAFNITLAPNPSKVCLDVVKKAPINKKCNCLVQQIASRAFLPEYNTHLCTFEHLDSSCQFWWIFQTRARIYWQMPIGGLFACTLNADKS